MCIKSLKNCICNNELIICLTRISKLYELSLFEPNKKLKWVIVPPTTMIITWKNPAWLRHAWGNHRPEGSYNKVSTFLLPCVMTGQDRVAIFCSEEWILRTLIVGHTCPHVTTSGCLSERFFAIFWIFYQSPQAKGSKKASSQPSRVESPTNDVNKSR